MLAFLQLTSPLRRMGRRGTGSREEKAKRGNLKDPAPRLVKNAVLGIPLNGLSACHISIEILSSKPPDTIFVF